MQQNEQKEVLFIKPSPDMIELVYSAVHVLAKDRRHFYECIDEWTCSCIHYRVIDNFLIDAFDYLREK